MDCREFGLLTKAFIFNELDDRKKIKEYLEHAKQCNDCFDELQVTYSMHRSLGDVMGPDGKDESSDYIRELEEIDEYYQEIFQMERKLKIIKLIGIIFITLILISVILRISLELLI